MKIQINLPQGGYDVIAERGGLQRAKEYFNLNRRVLVVTDSGVPADYAKTVAAQCKAPTVVTLPQGEASKNLQNFEMLCTVMAEHHFTRTDCAVGVGGGVVTDITGFAAACYMRGIDFYNVPTTVLAQVDASVGGKTAVDLHGIKNIVGAFHQPKGVLIDPAVNTTLAPRQFANGMAEAIKTAAILDKDLFALLETGDPETVAEEVVARCVALKGRVVEQDEKESGLRKILNYGHTVGHAVESLSDLFHGESVAVGMCMLCAPQVKARLVPLLKKYNLPTQTDIPPEKLFDLIAHDKKRSGENITYLYVAQIGACEVRSCSLCEFEKLFREKGELL